MSTAGVPGASTGKGPRQVSAAASRPAATPIAAQTQRGHPGCGSDIGGAMSFGSV